MQNDDEMTEQGTTEEVGDVGACEMDDVHRGTNTPVSVRKLEKFCIEKLLVTVA
jgi:hypothetical protein